jgi:DNA-binding beta-propeller fold protein YncE
MQPIVTRTAFRRLAGALLAAAACCAFPAAAGAQLFQIDGEFGSGVRPEGTFAQPAGVAVDNAGRVYVADSGSGRVEVFDSGEAGNGYLRSIGQDQALKTPVGVAVDLRNRIYVADSGKDTVYQYQPFIDDNVFFREWGGSGTELGKMSNPRFIVPDRSGLVYNTERGNARVQWFRPEEGSMVPVSAFGTAEPPSFSDPEGIVRDDNSGHLYVSDENMFDGEVRVYDGRGSLLGQIAGPGTGPGKVTSPRGLAIDPFGRLLVVDTGDSRLELFNSFSGGGGFAGSFGDGQLGRPVAAVFAPGAYLYVTDEATGKVIRFRYDDEDKDSVLEERDNCRGLANPDQSDIDRDRAGDACDDDDDGDGVPDARDACPTSRRGPDANGDGCSDVQSQVTSPGGGVAIPVGRPLGRVAGVASGGKLARVQYAIARAAGSRCRWYLGRGRFGGSAACDAPVWLRATGTRRWSAAVTVRTRGRYRVLSRALERGGAASASSAPRTFRLR